MNKITRQQRRYLERQREKAARFREKQWRWVSNDVLKPSVQNIEPNPGETPEQALAQHLKWRKQFRIGDPMPSKELSVEELKAAGIIGLYTKDIRKFL